MCLDIGAYIKFGGPIIGVQLDWTSPTVKSINLLLEISVIAQYHITWTYMWMLPSALVAACALWNSHIGDVVRPNLDWHTCCTKVFSVVWKTAFVGADMFTNGGVHRRSCRRSRWFVPLLGDELPHHDGDLQKSTRHSFGNLSTMRYIRNSTR